MADSNALPLRLVDGLTLDPAYRRVLRPDELVRDETGELRRLPRFFYEVDSWRTARETMLAPEFGLWEFINTDVTEARLLHGFPRYVPCAVTDLAASLAVFRAHVGTYVHVSVNGGYRSPGHGRTREASPHGWGVAANIYRIGDDYLDDQDAIDKYRSLMQQVLPAVWTRPFGYSLGYADDHLHVDLGYVVRLPRGAAGEDGREAQATAS